MVFLIFFYYFLPFKLPYGWINCMLNRHVPKADFNIIHYLIINTIYVKNYPRQVFTNQ